MLFSGKTLFLSVRCEDLVAYISKGFARRSNLFNKKNRTLLFCQGFRDAVFKKLCMLLMSSPSRLLMVTVKQSLLWASVQSDLYLKDGLRAQFYPARNYPTVVSCSWIFLEHFTRVPVWVIMSFIITNQMAQWLATEPSAWQEIIESISLDYKTNDCGTPYLFSRPQILVLLSGVREVVFIIIYFLCVTTWQS